MKLKTFLGGVGRVREPVLHDGGGEQAPGTWDRCFDLTYGYLSLHVSDDIIIITCRFSFLKSTWLPVSTGSMLLTGSSHLGNEGQKRTEQDSHTPVFCLLQARGCNS